MFREIIKKEVLVDFNKAKLKQGNKIIILRERLLNDLFDVFQVADENGL